MASVIPLTADDPPLLAQASLRFISLPLSQVYPIRDRFDFRPGMAAVQEYRT
jgi:hypothetical protein